MSNLNSIGHHTAKIFSENVFKYMCRHTGVCVLVYNACTYPQYACIFNVTLIIFILIYLYVIYAGVPHIREKYKCRNIMHIYMQSSVSESHKTTQQKHFIPIYYQHLHKQVTHKHLTHSRVKGKGDIKFSTPLNRKRRLL